MKASILSCVAALMLAACSSDSGASDPGTFSDMPAAVVMTDTGSYQFAVQSAPDATPTRGVNSLRFVVTRTSDGTPATGLALDVVPWMSAMGHGASVKPTVVAGTEPGSYNVTNVNLFMPGLWEIRTTIGGSTSDHVAPKFDIH